MNHVYRIVWNQLTQAWVAVAETAKGRGKTASRKLMAAALLLTGGLAQSGPLDGQVVSGAGSIAHTGNTTTITQTSAALSLTWKSFNVAANEKVHFVQPSASSLAINRIFDTNGSKILGQLNANGQVYLINPNGILFGAGAQVNVGALVASTLNFSDASLGGAVQTFSGSGSGTGSVVNQGNIQTATGGYVALMGNTVINQGRISAPMGNVALGAGSAVSLNFNGNSLVDMKVDQSVLGSLADNGGLIQAAGGAVLMSAGARNALLASVVNNTGIIEAQTVENHEGRIVLLGGMAAGSVKVSGTLDASAAKGGNGGFIETSAAKVQVADGAIITTAAPAGTTGTWLIDPFDFKVASTGGDITGAALGTLLASNSITIQTADTPAASATQLNGNSGANGDIFINDTVSWSANSTLTLDAWRNITINQSITSSGANGKLALKYGQGATDGVVGGVTASYSVNAPVNLKAGANFSTKLGSAGSAKNFTVITSLGAEGSTTTADLQGMNGDVTLNYAMGGNIDASSTSLWNTTAGVSAGFEPIGNAAARFSGTFDGLGHTISGFTINRPTANYVGLFGDTRSTTVISNVGLLGVNVTGNDQVGGLVGANWGRISGSYALGNVTGSMGVGGLVGALGGYVSNSYANANVIGGDGVGGLVGSSRGYVTGSHSAGDVRGSRWVGGLMGDSGGSLTNSYATGSVTGEGWVGGLVGVNDQLLSNSYATGRVTGHLGVGGLVGSNSTTGTLTNNYWNTTNALVGVGDGISTGVIGMTATQMQDTANFTGFTFTTTSGETGKWVIVNGDGSLNTAGSGGGTTPMLASEYSTRITSAHQLQLMAMAPDASYTLAADVNAAATGLIGGVSTDVWGSAGFVPVGNFTGVFDGLGRTISGLTINRPTANDVGLFGKTGSPAVISNVGLLGVNVTGKTFVGGLVGRLWGSTTASYVTGSVTGTSNVGGLVGYSAGAVSRSYATASVTGGNTVGGLVGDSDSRALVSNSYASGDVSGTGDYVGGLLGASESGVSSSYATGSVTGNNYVGGLVGYSYGGLVDYSYTTGAVSGHDHVGGLVGFSEGSISTSYASGRVVGSLGTTGGLIGSKYSGVISNSYWNKTNTAAGVGAGGAGGATGLEASEMLDASKFAGFNFTTTPGEVGKWVVVNGNGSLNMAGSGGGTTPMLASEYSTRITSAHQLQLMAMAPDASYTLAADVNAAATGLIGGVSTDVWGSAGFVPVGHFTGVFDGLGRTISGLTINRPTANDVGLFGKTGSPAVISNVGLLGVNVTGKTFVGGLVGRLWGSTTASYVTGSVTGTSNVGGLVGYSEGAVSTSYATASVTGGNTVGGLVGDSQPGALVSNSYASGDVSGTGDLVGGLLGVNRSGVNVSSSYATGSVTGNNYVGGLLGYSFGGLVSYSYATGDVSGNLHIGGLVGLSEGSISTSYASGRVVGSLGYTGGLIGFNYFGAISNSYWNKTNTAAGVGAGGAGGATGLEASEMLDASKFAGFNFTTTPGEVGKWVVVNGDGSLNTAGSGGGTTPMLASEYSTRITKAHQLQLMAMAPDASYTLAADVNAAATGLIGGVSTDVWGSAGFVPVGNFTGVFDGLGRTISGLTIYRPTTDYVGLFGSASSAVILNVGLIDASVTGRANVGSLAGMFSNGSVSGSYSTGNVLGTANFVGGLVGGSSGTVSASYANNNVIGVESVGGLMGSNRGFISDSYATGYVLGTSNSVGGLAGFSGGPVERSYAIGSVTGIDEVGGLVGSSLYSINESYATGNVSGGNNLGGLVGASLAVIDSSYATGSVSGTNSVGGLVGSSIRPISGSYASGAATGTLDVGGLIGLNDAASILTGNYWNKTNTPAGVGGASAVGATGLTTSEMQNTVNFSSFDFANTWFLYEGLTTPLLRSFLAPLTVTANTVSKTYDGLAYASTPGSAGVTYSTAPSVNLLGAVVYGGSAQGAVNAGSYDVTAGGLYSNQQGYIISYAAGALTINKADLSVTGSRVFDGGTTFAGSHLLALGVNGERFAVTGLGDASNLAVGYVQTDQVLSSVTGLALGGGATPAALASNYNPLSTVGSAVSVTPSSYGQQAGDLLAQQMSSRTGMPNLELPELTGGSDDIAGLPGPVPVSIAAGGVRLPAARFYP